MHGASYDDAYARARQICEERGLTYIHAYDDADVIAGQGTIGLEILEEPDMPPPQEFVPEPEFMGELRAPQIGLGD